jgi:hypothetical protein
VTGGGVLLVWFAAISDVVIQRSFPTDALGLSLAFNAAFITWIVLTASTVAAQDEVASQQR